MIAIYIHWPFCLSKCPYCDFNSHERNKIDLNKWKQAYSKQLDYYADFLQGKEISSIFFGGGTPSLMPPEIVEEIISKLNVKDIEITLEANPTSVEAKKFKEFKNAGVNRLSLGIQALNEQDLKFLGREHSKDEAIEAINLAREYFTNYSFDLIYARPNQTLEAWEEELNKALKLAANHISLYQLTIEKGTKFYKKWIQKEFELPNQDLAAKLYNLTTKTLKKSGLELYEISNYARPGFESKHNLAYWNYQEYLGIGPGAHSRLFINQNIEAQSSIYHPENWLASVLDEKNFLQSKEILKDSEIITEYIMMGLRLKKGLNLQGLEKHLKKEFSLNKVKLDKLISQNLISFNDNHLKLTKKGILLHNYVCLEIMD